MGSPLSRLEIVLGFWIRWVPGESVKRTWAFLINKQVLGWIAFATVVLSFLFVGLFTGWDKAKENLWQTAMVSLLPTIVIIAGRTLWDFLCVPAEMFESCIRRDVLKEICKQAMTLHREGSDLLLQMRESEWQNPSGLKNARDQWVSKVRNLLSSTGDENAWTFRFNDVTNRGVSALEDVGEPMRSAFLKKALPNEKYACEREITARLLALSDIVSEVGRLVSSTAVVDA